MLLFGADQFVISWVERHLKDARMAYENSTAIGVLNEESKMIAGVVYGLFTGHDIHMTIASCDPKWATRANLRTFFKYPFDQLGCERVTAITARKNKKARRMLERLGFTLEGVQRKGYDGTQDAMAYGMLKSECKWKA